MRQMIRRLSLILIAMATLLNTSCGDEAAAAFIDKGRSLQVAYEVDVVIAGGSSAAVSAAVNTVAQGSSVFLLADRPYLGEDLCTTLNLALGAGEKPIAPLSKEIYGDAIVTRPSQIKIALDKALVEARVPFLTGSYPCEVVVDAGGKFAGITMVNRSGRQFVKAKVLIDATENAFLARQTALSFAAFKAVTCSKFGLGRRTSI